MIFSQLCCFIRMALGETRCCTTCFNHLRGIKQSPRHQTATRRGPQTGKIVFDIACGIVNFRAYIFWPPTPRNYLRSTVGSRTVRKTASWQIEYGHTGHSWSTSANELRKGHFAEIWVGSYDWLRVRWPPPPPLPIKALCRPCKR